MDTMFISALARMPLGFVENWEMPAINLAAIVPTAIAAALYFAFLRTKPGLKNYALVPLVCGVVFGLICWFDSNQPGVKDFGDFGRKASMMFVVMWVLPLVAAVALLLWNKFGQGGRRVNY
ncbi:MAG: hypothetical protein JSS65_01325 [Armatimonadetes bacterium]|nr:hypothetical protein [Armatimonadota bacterium]